MLNVFLHFLNSFLLCLFFLAGLIPQLLQKSPIFTNPEFFFIAPAVFPNALYLPLVLVWSVVYAMRKVLKK